MSEQVDETYPTLRVLALLEAYDENPGRYENQLVSTLVAAVKETEAEDDLYADGGEKRLVAARRARREAVRQLAGHRQDDGREQG